MPKTCRTSAGIAEDVAGTFQGTYTISLLATIMAPGAPPTALPSLEDTDSDQEAIIVLSGDPNDETKVNVVLTMQDVDILEGLDPPVADDTYTLKFNLINFCQDQDFVITYETEISTFFSSP